MSWRPNDDWVHQRNEYFEQNQPIRPHHKTRQKDYEAGSDAIHKADVKWLIQRITHDDRGYVFNMNDKEWQEFIDV